MLECNITILPSDFQINPSNNRQDCELRTATPGNRFRDLEKVNDGDYNCYRNHNHKGPKNASEQRLANESEKTVGFHNLPSGFAVHHVLCFRTIVVHNLISFNGSFLVVVFLVFFDVGYLLGICLYDKDNAQNNPEDRTSRVVTGGKCTECAKRTEDDRDNSKSFHNSMTLLNKLHYFFQSIMS